MCSMVDIDLGTDINLDDIKADAEAFREKYSRDQDTSTSIGYDNWFEAQVEGRDAQGGLVKTDGFMQDLLTQCYKMSTDHRMIVGSLSGLSVIVNLEKQHTRKIGTKICVDSITFSTNGRALPYKMADTPDDPALLTDTEDKIYKLSRLVVNTSDPSGIKKLYSLINDAAEAVKSAVRAGDFYLTTRNELKADELQ